MLWGLDWRRETIHDNNDPRDSERHPFGHLVLFKQCWYVLGGGEMMTTYETLLADAALLPVDDRIQLIDAIWDTLPEESLPPLDSEWVAEIQRRSVEIDAGLAETIPWEQIRTEAMQRLRLPVPDASH